MRHLMYRPGWPLSDFVDVFWYYDGYTQPHAKERIMPDGSMQVVINLHEDEIRIYDPENPGRFERYGGSAFCGPRSRFEVIDTAGQRSVIGIQFRPGGAANFLRMPLSELQDRVVTLDCLWGLAGSNFRNRVLEAISPEARLRIFEQCLLEQRVKPLERHPAVRGALQFMSRQANLSIGDLTNQIGIGRRRFIQVFNDEIGLAPKLFCRVRRFQQALRRVDGKADIDWAD